jgi:hypothetical protein
VITVNQIYFKDYYNHKKNQVIVHPVLLIHKTTQLTLHIKIINIKIKEILMWLYQTQMTYKLITIVIAFKIVYSINVPAFKPKIKCVSKEHVVANVYN